MRPQEKAPWYVIVAVVAVGFAIVTAAQWAYPVKATPTPELNDRWRAWAKEIRDRAKASSPNSAPTDSTSGIPIAPP